MQVLVRDNNVEQALRVLKKKLQREGVFREMKRAAFYEKPSEKAAREKSEAIRRARKLARKQAIREGLIAAPVKKPSDRPAQFLASRLRVLNLHNLRNRLPASGRCRTNSGRHQIALVARLPKPYFNLWLICAGCPRSSRSGRAAPVHYPPAPGRGRFRSSCSSLIAMPFAIAPRHPAIRKGHVMSKRENDANNIFRPSDSPLTEYESKSRCAKIWNG